jgi:hypothetical protein
MPEGKDVFPVAALHAPSSTIAAASAAFSRSREVKRQYCHEPTPREQFTSHWAEKVAAHHRDRSLESYARHQENNITEKMRSASFTQLNQCVEDDPYLHEMLLQSRRHSQELALSGHAHLSDLHLRELRERIAFEHLVKGHPMDLHSERMLPEQLMAKCPPERRMPAFQDPSDVFARVALEQQMEAQRRKAKARASAPNGPANDHFTNNALLDLSMSEKRQRLDTDLLKRQESSPVSSSNQDDLPQQVPFVGASGIDEQHLCQVCGDIAAGFHCGAYVCEACKVVQLNIMTIIKYYSHFTSL